MDHFILKMFRRNATSTVNTFYRPNGSSVRGHLAVMPLPTPIDLRELNEYEPKFSERDTVSVAAAAATTCLTAYDEPRAYYILRLEPALIKPQNLDFLDGGRVSLEAFMKMVQNANGLGALLRMMENANREALVLTVS
jgi:hypothetical protein